MAILKSVKILAVDDEVQNTKILTEIMSFYPKYILKTAENGKQALQLLMEFKPDILLLDIMMPGMDGYEVCTKIRTMPEYKYLKIIMVSGLSLVNDRLKAYEVGADDYINKPFVEEELLAKIGVFSKLGRMEEIDVFKTTAMNLLVHETRTPLNGIYLSIDLLSNEIYGNVPALKYLDILRKSSERLKYLIEKISRYCVIRTGLATDEKSGDLQSFFQAFLDDEDLLRFEKLKFELNCKNEKLRVDWNLLAEALKEILLKILESNEGNDLDLIISIKAEVNREGLKITVGCDSIFVNDQDIHAMNEVLYSSDVLHYTSGMALNIAIGGTIINTLGGNLTYKQTPVGKIEFDIDIPLK